MANQEKLFHETKQERKDREGRLYYTLTAVLGILIVFAVLKVNAFPGNTTKEAVQIFCDGFFVSGSMLLSLWLIAWGWYHGVLDIFLYTAALFLSPFQKELDEHSREKRDFVTYRQQKKLERREPTHLLAVSSIFLGISIVLYLILIIL